LLDPFAQGLGGAFALSARPFLLLLPLAFGPRDALGPGHPGRALLQLGLGGAFAFGLGGLLAFGLGGALSLPLGSATVTLYVPAAPQGMVRPGGAIRAGVAIESGAAIGVNSSFGGWRFGWDRMARFIVRDRNGPGGR
jgi:hypothetical protein